jgi:Na+-driven multidrug efflux pump
VVFAGLIGARVVLSSIFALLGFPVEWIFAALIADYIVKAILLTNRYRSGRWRTVLEARSR